MASVPKQQAQVAFIYQGHVSVTSSNAGAQKYATTFYKLGCIQIVFAILSLILGAAVLGFALDNRSYYWQNRYYEDVFAYFGTGIWTSIFFFTSGMLGVIQRKKKTRCLVVAALTMTIFSALAACCLLGFEISGAISSYYGYHRFSRNYNEYEWNVSLRIHATLSVIGFAEFVTSIVHSAYCCGAHCCFDATTMPGQTTYAYVNPLPNQIPIIEGQQITFVPGPPVTSRIGGQAMQQQVAITTPQPVINYQVQGGFIPAQPKMVSQPEPNQEPPPEYQIPMKS